MIKKFFAALLVVGGLLLTFAAQAEIKTYTGVGEDYPNQFETPEDAKARALRSAIDDAKKQVGVGLKTYSRSINNELTEDEVSTITSNSYKIVGAVKYESSPKQLSEKSFTVLWRATVDVDVDDAEVKNWFKRTADEKKALINRNRAAEEAFNADIKTAEDLNKRAAKPLTEIEEFDLRHEVEASNNDFQVNQKIEDGNRLNYEDKPAEALEQYGEALEIKFVDGVGEYRMLKDVENLEISKARSKGNAEQVAVKAGVHYLKNYSQRINLELTDDEIFTIANGTYEIVDTQQQIISSEDDLHLIIRTNARLKFKGDEVISWLKRDKSEREKIVEETMELKRKLDENEKEIERLKEKYESKRRS
ncbi:MAG: hypothetical protein IJG33_10590 [Selenomonadaceae bacterium]|nr:hypothetical protein [Selenomonadaceae bacterium]